MLAEIEALHEERSISENTMQHRAINDNLILVVVASRPGGATHWQHGYSVPYREGSNTLQEKRERASVMLDEVDPLLMAAVDPTPTNIAGQHVPILITTTKQRRRAQNKRVDYWAMMILPLRECETQEPTPTGCTIRTAITERRPVETQHAAFANSESLLQGRRSTSRRSAAAAYRL